MTSHDKTRKVTMKDVARQARVALGTVSRIVNGNATVTPELRKHVETVIDQLGYRPNPTARTLRTNRTNAIGIIVTDLRQPIAARLAAAASEVVRGRGSRRSSAISWATPAAKRPCCASWPSAALTGCC